MRTMMMSLILFWTTQLIAAPILVGEFKPLADFEPKMECDKCRVFQVEDDVLKIKGFGHLWTQDQVYDITDGKQVVVEVKTRLHFAEVNGKQQGSVFTLGFSANRQSWDSQKEGQDALTFKIGCSREASKLTTVRSQMYRKLLKTTPYILPAEQWESLKIMFSEKELIAYGDNVELIRVDLTNVDFPKKGYVGFLTRGFHRVLWEVKDLNIYQVK